MHALYYNDIVFIIIEPVVPKERVLTCWPPSNPNVPQRGNLLCEKSHL